MMDEMSHGAKGVIYYCPNVFLKRCVFSTDLKVDNDGDCLIMSGRSFQDFGAITKKPCRLMSSYSFVEYEVKALSGSSIV